jgi:hypothetical protein
MELNLFFESIVMTQLSKKLFFEVQLRDKSLEIGVSCLIVRPVFMRLGLGPIRTSTGLYIFEGSFHGTQFR